MTQRSYYKRGETGWTLLDLLVIMSGAALGGFVSGYFHGGWRAVMVCVLGPVFGLGFWYFLFVWLLPLIELSRKR